jgi:NADH-quinone oxidoreductase subunit N
MAYSSINHVSFILLGMACGNLMGLTSTLLYLLVYSVTLLAFFGFILNARCLITGRTLIYLSDFANLSKLSGLIETSSLLIILFSMGGIPPLAGFFIKFYIYIEAISSGFYFFVFFSLIITIISTFYYLFFLKSLFFDNNL